MSASDGTYTYDRLAADGGPYVPDVADLGGEISDDPQNLPAEDEPSAGLYNERRENIAGLNRCNWFATIWVLYSGGYSVEAVDLMGTLPTIASFVPTSGATGTIVITWTAGTVPAMARRPHAWLTGSHGAAYAEVTSANSVTIYLRNMSNAAVNASFAVELR